jgi:hypothetical protein
MRKFSLLLILLLAVGGFTTLTPGCSRNSPSEPAKDLVQASGPLNSRQYADYHNRQVDRLTSQDHRDGCLKRILGSGFEEILREMEKQNPHIAVSRWEIRKSRELLPTLEKLHNRGHQPGEIHSLLELCLREFGERPGAQHLITANLNLAVRLLIARDIKQLGQQLEKLATQVDRWGSPAEKCVVGVMLGSFERALDKLNQGVKFAQYWPCVVMYDMIGSLVGGAGVASIFSAWAETIFIGVFFP